jgi:hypothetical protein
MKAWMLGAALAASVLVTQPAMAGGQFSESSATPGASFAFADSAWAEQDRPLDDTELAEARGGAIWLPLIFGTIGVDLALFGAFYGVYVPYYADPGAWAMH